MLFRRRPPADKIGPRLAPGRLPADERIYAIGDVHGLADRLRALHAAIAADLAARPVPAATLIHLGDLIDRGPNSAGVIERLADPRPIPGLRHRVNLLGNHEAMMLAALAAGASSDDATRWLDNGGEQALRSWRIDRALPVAEWATRIPPAHRDFLSGLGLTHRIGDYLFVHAGIRPGVPLDRQTRDDLIWIRQGFLDHQGDLGCIVVHGHSPTREPEVLANRINVDTGAVLGGSLTCAVLEGQTIRFLVV